MLVASYRLSPSAQQAVLRHEVLDLLVAVLRQRRLLGLFVDRVIGPDRSPPSAG